MRLPRIFRRTRPTPPAPPSLHPHDVAVIRWHLITEHEWRALDNPTRAELRTIYMKVTMP